MAGGAPSARKKSKTFDISSDGGRADDEAHSKGGHSLRKRTRIDYTQEMIDDDLGIPLPRSDLLARQSATPTARGRKKRTAPDDSGDESDDFAVTHKRRRADRSPATARAASSRRRNASKKPAAEVVETYVDQPSDNDVKDTILVSISVNGGQSAEESDNSSSHEPEPRPSSSASPETDGAQDRAKTPSPSLQPAHPVEDAVLVASRDEEAAGEASHEDVNHEHVHDAAQTSVGHGALPVRSEQPQPHSGLEVALSGAETTNLPDAGPQHMQELAQDRVSGKVNTPARPPAAGHAAGPENGHALLGNERESGLVDGSIYAQTPPDRESSALQTSPSNPPLSNLDSRQSSHTMTARQATRLRQLEAIYDEARPFASYLGLTPYEDEDVAHPGPYTEWVYPVTTVREKPTPTPAPTRPPTPSPAESQPAEVEWDGHRRLKMGEFFALYSQEKKRREEKGEAAISMVAFHNECVRKYKAAKREAAQTPSDAGAPAAEPAATAAPLPDALLDSQTVESQLPTAVPSPTPVEDDVAEEDGVEEEDQDPEEAADEQAEPEVPAEPVEVTRNPAKQYLFPKIRDHSEFAKALSGFQDMDTGNLYDVLAAAAEALNGYQKEYLELRKILDDEDNAKRRQAYDKKIVNWENRQKADDAPHSRRHFDDAVRAPASFEVRGVRAPKPYIDDPVLEHQREEDRIMAQAYGFKHNNHPTLVGRQNPDEQRWEMPESRLRRRTEKGAELAEENVVEGKRVRKPRYVSDQSKDPSRSGTPTGAVSLGPGRRQKRKHAAAAAQDEDVEGTEHGTPVDSPAEPPRKGRGARARGPTVAGQEQDADNRQTDDEQAMVEHKPKASRKRDRVSAAFAQAPTSVPEGFQADTTKPKAKRGAKEQQQQQQTHHQGAGEIASSSFYSNTSTMAAQPESRPSTASSDASAHTVDTVASTYSLRGKRKRNFAFENDPELETRSQKRGRAAAAQKEDQAETEPKKRAPRKRATAGGQPSAPVALDPTANLSAANTPPPSMAANFRNIVPGSVPQSTNNAAHRGPPHEKGASRFVHTFNVAPAFPPGTPPPPPEPPAVKKPITKIRLTNNGSSSQWASRAATPANGTPATTTKAGAKAPRGNKSGSTADGKVSNPVVGNGEYEKPYAEMTKSEKMSWSMRSK